MGEKRYRVDVTERTPEEPDDVVHGSITAVDLYRRDLRVVVVEGGDGSDDELFRFYYDDRSCTEVHAQFYVNMLLETLGRFRTQRAARDFGEKIREDREGTYPREDGDTIVLGPEIFASSDGEVISWKGENYVRKALPDG